jgi:hypothetical protein
MFPAPVVVPFKKKRKRGRQPPDYGPRICPWCASLLKFDPNAKRHYCVCGWME